MEDPDAIELLLDADQPRGKTTAGASGDALLIGGVGRQGVSGPGGHASATGAGPRRFWQRIRRQWRDFRFRFARRFSRVFRRRSSYRSSAVPSLTNQDTSSAAPAD